MTSMSHKTGLIILFLSALILDGCGNYHRQGIDPKVSRGIEETIGLKGYSLSREAEDEILALDPENVTEEIIRGTLSKAPAPRLINIHGGLDIVREYMISFSTLLIGMGYPESSIRNPGDGTWTFSCYESADKITGTIAWYYEKEGLRPMIVGYSQGGMQAVKVLDRLAGSRELEVWNPLTWKNEGRTDITDPITGKKRPVAGLKLPYVASMCAGGMGRILPNQWDMTFRLRTVPDSVEEFTGFYKCPDLLGGDLLGCVKNRYKPSGAARVRNVEMPGGWDHVTILDTQHLLKSQANIDRMNSYHPPSDPVLTIMETEAVMAPETLYLPWVQDVWFSIKKHWVLELQRLIRARRGMPYDG